MINFSLGFIGGGRVTRIFLQAFENKKAQFESILTHDINQDVLTDLKNQYPNVDTAGDLQKVSGQSIVFIALHPPVIMDVMDQIKDIITPKTVVISLAPKLSIEKLSSKLNTGRIIRMIPNATSYINEGYNPVTFGKEFPASEKTQLLDILELLGRTLQVDESKLEAYAIISAMLPTYFWFQWKEIEELGVQMGLTPEQSCLAVRDTLQASIHLMFDSGLSPEQVIDLIPVKPIGENEDQILEIYRTKLMGLFQKISP